MIPCCRSCGCAEDLVGPLDTEALCPLCAQARREEGRKAAGWRPPAALSPTFQGLQARALEAAQPGKYEPGAHAAPWSDNRPLPKKGKVCPVISRPHDLVPCMGEACEAWRCPPRREGATGYCVLIWGCDE